MQNFNPKSRSWDTKAQTWDFIENRYITDWAGKHGRLLELVRHIKNSDLANRLYGSTSMDKLVVSNGDPIDYAKEALHVTFDLYTRMWHFEYKEERFRKSGFIRDYREEDGIAKFDNFIKMIGW